RGEAVAEHVAIGTTTRLQIKHTGSISGVARRDGAPPDQLVVRLADLKTGYAREETFYKTEGRFSITDLPHGHFQQTATTDGGSKMIEVDLAEGETKTGVTVTLDALVSITGRVVDLVTRKPVSGMRVVAQLAASGDETFSYS